MSFDILKNKAALTFLVIGAISLTVGGYDAWSAQHKQSKTSDKTLDIKQYQNISKDIKNIQNSPISSISAGPEATSKLIKIDVSGAVISPSVYDLNNNSRISDALDKAGGIDQKRADLAWVARNINLATLLNDGDKIYIPTKSELIPKVIATPSPTVLGVGITQGFLGYQQSLSTPNISPQEIKDQTKTTQTQSSSKVSINNSSSKELDTLPGIGEVTAQKIIQSRPYNSVEDLKNKKIVKPSVYKKIKDLIIL